MVLRRKSKAGRNQAKTSEQRSHRNRAIKKTLVVAVLSLAGAVCAITVLFSFYPERVFYFLFKVPPSTFSTHPEFRFHSLFPPSVRLVFHAHGGHLEAIVSPAISRRDNYGARIRMKVEHPDLGISVVARGIVEKTAEGAELRLFVPRADFSSPWVSLEERGKLHVKLDSRFDPSSAKIEFPKLALKSFPVADLFSRSLRFAFEFDATFSEPVMEFKYHVKETTLNLKWPGTGRLDLVTHDGSVQQLAGFKFAETLQPAMLLPRLGKLKDVKGSLTFSGHAVFKSGEPRSISAVARVEKVSGFVDTIRFRELDTKIEAQLFPRLRTIRPAQISLRSVGQGLSARRLSLKASLDDGRTLAVDGLKARVLKGDLTAPDFKFDLEQETGRIDLQLKGVEVARLAKVLIPDRLTGTGKLGGWIPLEMRKGRLLIEGAKLANEGPGVLSYKDELTIGVKEKIDSLDDFTGLLAKGQQALAFKALNNFHFSVLSLAAHRGTSEGLSVELKLKGKNPDLAKGQPFELNLPISGNVESLVLRSLVQSYEEEDSWE